MGVLENSFKQVIADSYTRMKGNGEASVDILFENWQLASVSLLEVYLYELQHDE